MDNRLKWATLTAIHYIGESYKWAGDDPMAGFDCSGFVIEVLRSGNILPLKGDWSAAELFDYFKNKVELNPCEGCLVFFCGINTVPFHVEYCLDKDFSIGASGGDSRTVDINMAIKQNAYVKIRTFRNRSSALLKFVNPFKEV